VYLSLLTGGCRSSSRSVQSSACLPACVWKIRIGGACITTLQQNNGKYDGTGLPPSLGQKHRFFFVLSCCFSSTTVRRPNVALSSTSNYARALQREKMLLMWDPFSLWHSSSIVPSLSSLSSVCHLYLTRHRVHFPHHHHLHNLVYQHLPSLATHHLSVSLSSPHHSISFVIIRPSLIFPSNDISRLKR
jgi:hypothetical protein